MAIVIDVGSFWNASIHVQLAAEAAALAGVPYMPGDFTTAPTAARAEAAKNGFERSRRDGHARRSTPSRTAAWTSRLGSFGTYFLRIFGMNSVRITRTATAEYTLPVPDGQPAQHVRRQHAAMFWAARHDPGRGPDLWRCLWDLLQPEPTPNNQYDPNGYLYAIEVPAGAGATNIDLYDPAFCAVDAKRAPATTGSRGTSRDGPPCRSTTRCGRTPPDAARLLATTSW